MLATIAAMLLSSAGLTTAAAAQTEPSRAEADRSYEEFTAPESLRPDAGGPAADGAASGVPPLSTARSQGLDSTAAEASFSSPSATLERANGTVAWHAASQRLLVGMGSEEIVVTSPELVPIETVTIGRHLRWKLHGDLIVIERADDTFDLYDLGVGSIVASYPVGSHSPRWAPVGDELWASVRGWTSRGPLHSGPLVCDESIPGAPVHVDNTDYVDLLHHDGHHLLVRLEDDDTLTTLRTANNPFIVNEGQVAWINRNTNGFYRPWAGPLDVLASAVPFERGPAQDKPSIMLAGDHLLVDGIIYHVPTGNSVVGSVVGRGAVVAGAAVDGVPIFYYFDETGVNRLRAYRMQAVVERLEQDLYAPTESPQLSVRGANLALIDQVTVNGVPVESRAVQVEAIPTSEVRLLIDAIEVTTSTATIEFFVGSTSVASRTLPTELQRGEGLLTVFSSRTGTAQPTHGSLDATVRCWNGSLARPDRELLLTPGVVSNIVLRATDDGCEFRAG